MKKLLLTLAIILLGSVCFATTIGYKLEKAVNGDWEHDYIIDYTIGGDYQAYLNTEAVFVAPRNNPFAPNHEYFGLTFGGKLKVYDWDVDAGTQCRWMWQGNSQGLTEGFNDWSNYMRLTKEI